MLRRLRAAVREETMVEPVARRSGVDLTHVQRSSKAGRTSSASAYLPPRESARSHCHSRSRRLAARPYAR